MIPREGSANCHEGTCSKSVLGIRGYFSSKREYQHFLITGIIRYICECLRPKEMPMSLLHSLQSGRR